MKITAVLFSLFVLITIPCMVFAQDSGVSKDSTIQSTEVPKKKAVFLNELPKDLAQDSLVVLLEGDYSEANRNKNAKYREFFLEYPYPVLLVQSPQFVAATKRHKYELTYIETEGLAYGTRTGRVKQHTYSIRYNGNNIYYRITSCINCEKTELACLHKFIKAIARRQDK